MPSPVSFKKTILDYYKQNGRSFPWRKTNDPYKILVSEIMLQQTQAPRVIEKYHSFLKRFPTIKKLAKASTASVLREWQGLGYNRRGLALKNLAVEVMKKYNGTLPKKYDELISLPGIGPATAGDLLAFAWNKPAIVIETNIRTVFIHHFFKDQTNISDQAIIPLIKKTLDKKNPRKWYWALMDYGAFLKKTLPNPSRRSRHYTKQSPFRGSNREIRSKILKYLLLYKKQSLVTIAHSLSLSPEIIQKNLIIMKKEKLISSVKKGNDTLFSIVR